MYSREQIEKVRSSIDIVEVVREYVPSLTVSGRSVRGLCPFHHERTPSFHVQPEKGFFKCFGCGEAGDVIGFVSKLENVNFTEALEKLAGQAGVVLQKATSQTEKRQDDVKDKLYRLLDDASRIYQQTLQDERMGQAARNYLDERGVSKNRFLRLRKNTPAKTHRVTKTIKDRKNQSSKQRIIKSSRFGPRHKPRLLA